MSDPVYEVTIKGIRPLLMHNGRLCNPLDPFTKELKAAAKKRSKGDDDLAEVARIEFEGGLYHDKNVGPYLPVDVLQAAIERGATKRKLGKTFKAHVGIVEPESGPSGYALKYKGPRDVKGLFSNPDFVLTKGCRVGQSRVMRTRPRIPSGWTVTFRAEVLANGVTKAELEQAIADAGIYEGLCDWRPRYGRFVVESVKQVS